MEQACKTNDVPAACEIYFKMSRDEEFARNIAHARTSQQHAEVDRTIDLADAATPENWSVVRLQIAARQWRAGKLNPKVYGDKMLHTGADGEGPVAVKLSLDYTLLEPAEMLEFRRMLAKMERKGEPPMIEGAAEED